MNTEYTVEYFIKKFQAIPEDLWMTGQLQKDGKRCAFGHCDPIQGYMCKEGLALSKALQKPTLSIALINDGGHVSYKQPTAKQRILAALYDIKAKENKDTDIGKVSYIDLTKSLAVLPVEETSDTKQLETT
jgi:hypothetical protein